MKKRINILLSLAYVVAFAFVLLPFLLCAPYARAVADDWSNGIDVYYIVRNGGGVFACIKAAIDNVIVIYRSWEGRFFSVFLFAFSPGNWQERYYGVVPFVLIFSQIIGQIMFYRFAFGKKILKYLPFILTPALIMQFLYVGEVSQVYFWFVGGIGYTFVQAVAYIQWGMLLALFWNNSQNKRKTTALCIATTVLGFLVSGGNYASAISTFCITWLLAIIMFIWDRSRIRKMVPVLISCTLGIVISLLSPGNMQRVGSNFGGETSGPIESIFNSLWTTALNIYSWVIFNKGWVIILMTLPAVILLSKELRLKIKHPLLILFFTYGIYASEIVANIYVEGTTGGWRNGAILYGSYYIFLTFNMICMISFILSKHTEKTRRGRFAEKLDKYGILSGSVIFAALLICIIITGEYRSTASYMAYRDYRQGWARDFAKQWDERFEILRDDSEQNPVFHQLSEPHCATLEYTDLQLPDGYVWVNEACRQYYRKESITVIP